jgi:hypothetical protein
MRSIDDLRTRWDWSKVKAHLVPSIAGKHEGWPNVVLTGHPRLMKVVRSIGMRTGKAKGNKDLVLECQVGFLSSTISFLVALFLKRTRDLALAHTQRSG